MTKPRLPRRETGERFSRQRFSNVIYLFREGSTEYEYLKEISIGSGFQIVPRSMQSDPVFLVNSAVGFLSDSDVASDFVKNPGYEVWIVFDDDEKPVISTVMRSFPAMLRRIKNASLRTRVHVAFMKPCIELWAVLCLKDGIRLYTNAPGHRKMESLLRKHMPSYRHDGCPYFDIAKMPEWKKACEQARQWEGTWGTFPNCNSATWFAGIHELVRRIQEAKQMPLS